MKTACLTMALLILGLIMYGIYHLRNVGDLDTKD
jgi:hypothetical protein